MSARPIVAAFDVDGTLTTRDCVVPFLRRTLGLPRIAAGLARRPWATVRALLGRDRDRLKELAVAGFAGRDAQTIDASGREFAALVAASWLRPDTPARLAWHRRQGHRVVLVSASLDPYLRPLGEHLGVDAVLCATLGRDGGRLTGRLAGPNCRGAEKVRRLEAWLGGQEVDLWAYGDSAGDRELLARADVPHLVAAVTVAPVPAGFVS